MGSKGHKPDCDCNFCGGGSKNVKGELHTRNTTPARDDQAPRDTRQQAYPKKKKRKRPAGPGRPKGSVVSKETGLTPNQERIAHKMLEAELDSGLFPTSVGQVAKVAGSQPEYIRILLAKKEFQAYVFKLLELEGVILEGAFWRGLALGLSVGDSKVLELYAKMTGKITAKTESKIEVIIKGVDGTQALDWGDEIIEVEVIEDD